MNGTQWIGISEIGFDRIEAFLSATPKQVDQAIASTCVKMARWLTTKSVRELARHLNLPQKEVRRRLRTFRMHAVDKRRYIRVWYGLDPIGAIHLGAKDQRAPGGGVAAYGGRFFKGAFIAKGRAGNGNASESNRQVFERVGRARLKIKKVTVALSDPAQTYIEDHLLGGHAFTDQFYKTFEHELTWRQQRSQ
jgi:DNA-binding Lrp family transcriptional regulator